MNCEEIIEKLRSMEKPEAVKGMARYGINPENNLGISIGDITRLSKEIGKNHKLAQELWKTKIRDARLLACLIEEPKQVSNEQLEAWVSDFNSWDLCDHCCMHLLDKTPFAYAKVQEWVAREPEYTKRAGFALLASLTLHDKKIDDKEFLKYLPLIKDGAFDERNYVKKAVNWSLRTIGKRSLFLNQKAIEVAKEIQKLDSKVAKWIANDAIRELSSDKILARLKKRENKMKKKK